MYTARWFKRVEVNFEYFYIYIAKDVLVSIFFHQSDAFLHVGTSRIRKII